MKSSKNDSMVTTRQVTIASIYSPAPQMMPVLIDQNRKSRSMGFFMALRKRTMERAPTIPNEITREA